MVLSIFWILFSLVLLYFGAEWLVKGSSSIALRMGISPLVVGLTIVAFGTSTPELIVSVTAALNGNSAIAVGNVVGSNIFNIGAILGISALVFPLSVQRQLLRFDMPVMIGITALFVMLFWNGSFGRLEGAIFLIGIFLYTILLIVYSKKTSSTAPASSGDIPAESPTHHWGIDLLWILGGLGILMWGSDLLVEHASIVARALDVSEAVIGLTIVAAGTSMPELATSVVAAFKRNTDIAIGNIVGSNIYNLMAIMGTSALIKPIYAPEINRIDILSMLFFALLLLPLMRTGFVIKRKEGVLLLICYVSYLSYLIYMA